MQRFSFCSKKRSLLRTELLNGNLENGKDSKDVRESRGSRRCTGEQDGRRNVAVE